MPVATAKPSNLPPRYSLPELALPAVLPTDARIGFDLRTWGQAHVLIVMA